MKEYCLSILTSVLIGAIIGFLIKGFDAALLDALIFPGLSGILFGKRGDVVERNKKP